MKKPLFFLFLFCVPGAGLFAQGTAGGSNSNNSQSSDDQNRIKVRVELVNVLTTVTDKKNRLVTDLTKDDFRIFGTANPKTSAFSAARPTSPYASGS